MRREVRNQDVTFPDMLENVPNVKEAGKNEDSPLQMFGVHVNIQFTLVKVRSLSLISSLCLVFVDEKEDSRSWLTSRLLVRSTLSSRQSCDPGVSRGPGVT
ncbi:hypothetical protein CpipJ_CPIJ016235 [Culex quinquefasciatus]|uniref:Uncharacterized protein n=1 Tax=Culex quinquefasciatus TaxID=7176 RepID=B0XAB1_CULQU|nr:hypothetical protein CpipJ_CPIJ016235 [Culex quinquefasciatus]|eukprot:XP_001866583.1 hypothetical protein CpipJ_CPIJ016235 [Culex quinquefasciatus]